MDIRIISLETLTVKKIGTFFKLSPIQPAILFNRKDFPAIKINQCYRIPTAAFLKWLEKESGASEVKAK